MVCQNNHPYVNPWSVVYFLHHTGCFPGGLDPGLLEVFGDDAFPDPCLRTGEGQQGVSFEVIDLLPGVSPSPACCFTIA